MVELREHELDRQRRVLQGETVVASVKDDSLLVAWAQDSGLGVYIDRRSRWGNPFKIGRDGNRDEVIAKHRDWLSDQPELLKDLQKLSGKVLVCHCHPEGCHGDTLAELANQAGYEAIIDAERD